MLKTKPIIQPPFTAIIVSVYCEVAIRSKSDKSSPKTFYILEEDRYVYIIKMCISHSSGSSTKDMSPAAVFLLMRVQSD